MHILKKFENGRSGSDTYLASLDGMLVVHKVGLKNADKIIDKMRCFPFNVPDVYSYTETSITMQYIDGKSIKEILKPNNLDINKMVAEFIISYIQFSLNHIEEKNFDFSQIIDQKINQVGQWVDIKNFDGIRKSLPKTLVHGDFTFDNLVYKDSKIYMIDFSLSPFSSIYFDINKLQQDLTGMWFVRDEPDPYLWRDSCSNIYKIVESKFPDIFDTKLYRLMVSRILPYCENHLDDREYVIKMIKKEMENEL